MRKLSVGIGILFFTLIMSCKYDKQPQLENISKEEQTNLLLENGKEIASSTFLSLSGELQKAMKTGGFEHALSYCNLNAIALTDSLSVVHNAEIKRTSLKYRNPKNKPTPIERRVLTEFEVNKRNGKTLSPQVVKESNQDMFYAPIIVQDMCLKCHGKKEDMANYNLISGLYPDDLAYGYQQGELRGMWSISFRN